MKTIAVVSLKGGTGRTTITANLARVLDRSGRPAVALDLDPQNALGLHFGMAPTETLGLASPSANPCQLREVSARSVGRVSFVPFGRPTFADLRALETSVGRDPQWLRRMVRAVVPTGTACLVVDTPAHGGAWLEQVLPLADVALIVLRPDAASFATLPRLESLLDAFADGRALRRAYLLNGVDPRRTLTRDVVAALEDARPGEVLPFWLPEDEHVRESLARQRTLVDDALGTGLVEPLWQLGEWVTTALGRPAEPRAPEPAPAATPVAAPITLALGAG